MTDIAKLVCLIRGKSWVIEIDLNNKNQTVLTIMDYFRGDSKVFEAVDDETDNAILLAIEWMEK